MSDALMGMDRADLEQALGASEPAYRARQIYEAIYNQRIKDIGSITGLPSGLRDRLRRDYRIGLPQEAARFDSADGTRRYLLRLDDGKTVEAVFMPEEGRDTLCISSQVGCPVDCKFCLTALMGLERNLTAGEILGQVAHLTCQNGLWADARRLNLVIMGQGEPLLNLDNLAKACGILTDKCGLGISARRVTVSTSGLLPRIEEYARWPDAARPKLAISLNASTEEQRRELMPVTRKYHLKDLIETCRRYRLRSWESLTFEYVLLKGVNDSEADARRVVKLLAGMRAKVNLIALNPGPGIPYDTPEPESVAAFQEIVRRRIPCFVRKPRGLDVFAACGQLKRMSVDSNGAPLVPALAAPLVSLLAASE